MATRVAPPQPAAMRPPSLDRQTPHLSLVVDRPPRPAETSQTTSTSRIIEPDDNLFLSSGRPALALGETLKQEGQAFLQVMEKKHPALAHQLASELQVASEVHVPAWLEGLGKPTVEWTFRTGNDNLAHIVPPVGFRDDDGTTASLGTHWRKDFGDFQWEADVDYMMLTERFGGLQRTDLVSAMASYTAQHDKGAFVLELSGSAGLHFTGNMGGARVQDTWHAITPFLGGRRLGAGLQNTYTGPLQAAVVTGGRAEIHKPLGDHVQVFGGAQAQVPIGSTSFGYAGGHAGVSASFGRFSLEAETQVRQQWTQGSALGFDGAPIEGGVVIPRVSLAYQADNWRIGVDWVRNHMGTEPGAGNPDSDHLTIGFTIMTGRR